MSEHPFDPLETVSRLASSLDSDDFESAASLIADDCVYTLRGGTLVGPEVIESYRRSSMQAHDLFDDIGYEHSIIGEIGPHTYRVHFFDELTIKGERVVHLSEQDMTVHPDRGVVRIVDNPIDGEKEKVDLFLERHGLSRS